MIEVTAHSDLSFRWLFEQGGAAGLGREAGLSRAGAPQKMLANGPVSK